MKGEESYPGGGYRVNPRVIDRELAEFREVTRNKSGVSWRALCAMI